VQVDSLLAKIIQKIEHFFITHVLLLKLVYMIFALFHGLGLDLDVGLGQVVRTPLIWLLRRGFSDLRRKVIDVDVFLVTAADLGSFLVWNALVVQIYISV